MGKEKRKGREGIRRGSHKEGKGDIFAGSWFCIISISLQPQKNDKQNIDRKPFAFLSFAFLPLHYQNSKQGVKSLKSVLQHIYSETFLPFSFKLLNTPAAVLLGKKSRLQY